MPTKIISNLSGRLTRYEKGDMNSGLAKYATSFGYDAFKSPSNLQWVEAPARIDPNEDVITDLIMDGKERVESGILYLYCIGHTGRVYKIQINSPSSFNPDYDNPVLLATIASGSPTFTRGGFIEFFGTTERIFIGHDKGITRLDFDGNNETVVGVVGSFTQNVPRPFREFVGNLVFGNGNNIGLIDSTATVSSYTKLSPSFPNNTQVRDLDVSIEGNYLHIVVSRLALPNIISGDIDTSINANLESYNFKWNGIDVSYSAYDIYPTFSLTANITFSNFQYIFGYDLAGTSIFNPRNKILSPIFSQAPMPNAVGNTGNLVGWQSPEFNNGFLRTRQFIYGFMDNEVGLSWISQYAQVAQGTETDVKLVPFQKIVSGFGIGSATSGYTGGIFNNGKVYFSTLETSSSPTTKYKLYKWVAISRSTGTFIGGIYETQTELFSERIAVKEIRAYIEPLVANNEFKLELIGSNEGVITNSDKTFTVGTNVSVGDDLVRYSPDIQPTYALGLRVTNIGSKNWILKKVEIDYEFVKS